MKQIIILAFCVMLSLNGLENGINAQVKKNTLFNYFNFMSQYLPFLVDNFKLEIDYSFEAKVLNETVKMNIKDFTIVGMEMLDFKYDFIDVKNAERKH